MAGAAASGPLILAVVGPECTGKTTLARALAQRLEAPWLPEYARGYLERRLESRLESRLEGSAGAGGSSGASYDEADLQRIARGQLAGERVLLERGAPVVVLDTDLIVIQVWWQERFGRVPDWVVEEIRRRAPREYLLAKPDLPWQADPLRESPTDRKRLFAVYRRTLEDYGAPFVEIEGRGEARLELALVHVRQRLRTGGPAS